MSTRKWFVPSNDFSAMISSEMYDEVFLPGIQEECRLLDASIYHLDGPDALRHLDSVLGIDELNALQWVRGAGNGAATDWLHVYKRAQQAGKGVYLQGVSVDEVETIMEHLRPDGVWMQMSDVKDRETADQVLKRVTKWT